MAFPCPTKKEKEMNHLSGNRVLLIIGLLTLLLLWGCKDSDKTDSVSLLEQCKIYLDDGKWSDAIETCEDAGGDDGYHYAAQAYMGSGGLSLFNLVRSLSSADDGSGSGSTIFGYVPETETQKENFQTALRYLMGPNITEKSQTVYFESLLLSSILVLTELKTSFNLSVVDGEIDACSIDATEDADQCGFTFDLTTDVTSDLTFGGLGRSFHENLCCELGNDTCTAYTSTHDGTSITTPSVVAYDVTADSCTVQAGSTLRYNKDAFDNFTVTDAFKDDNGDSVLSTLDFYSLFDSGSRFDASGDEIVLCKNPPFTDITSDNGVIYDCEILGAVLDPSSDLFANE